MAKSGQEIVYEGWLTKSPPTKRIWRARWRRRWFSLKHSGEIPNQFILTYYADRNCRKLKGSINLDYCEQVDLGLKLDKRKLKFDHVFDIKTPTRTYYLAADSENDMKSWVNCICKVCGLKSTSDEEDLHISENNAIGVDVIYSEETKDSKTNNETPCISPVSTSPYIPISECITGKTPILNSQDLKILLEQNRKNSYKSDSDQPQNNHQANTISQRNYLNYVNDINDPQFYDCPRVLVPKQNSEHTNEIVNKKDKNQHSPLQSPTDTDSVFTDDDNTELDVSVVRKFIKSNKQTNDNKTVLAPPRPPKTPMVAPPPSSTYMNIYAAAPSQQQLAEDEKAKSEIIQQKIAVDEMYDFPRSHQTEAEIMRNNLQRRHCYNNAVKVEGQIFRYDMSPKPSTSTSQVFRYDLDDLQDEPASPLSQSSSTTAYSNLPSPLLADNMLPPVVNRDLKPKRKLSDSLSSCSNPEPSSPRAAPSVDRKLKPPTPLQEAHMRKAFLEVKASPTLSLTRKTLGSEEEGRKMMSNLSPTHSHLRKNSDEKRARAAPSPTPPGLGRSHESLLSQNQVEHYLSNKIQYLDLDLACGTSSNYSENNTNTMPLRAVGGASDTVYKKVDFEKTYAFNITRNNLEKERKEPFTFKK